MKTFGIYTAYPPGTVFTGEGLGRLLVALIKGGAETESIRFVIACPGWSREPLERLMDTAGVPKHAVEFLSPPGIPCIITWNQWWRQREVVRKALPRRGKKIPPCGNNGAAGKRALGWLLRSRHPGFLLLTIGIAVPLLLLVGLVLALVKGVEFLTRGLRQGMRPLERLRTKLIRRLDHLAGSRLLQDAELRSLHRLINARQDVACWYCPTAFWPSFNEIPAPRVLCVPDFVVAVCPVAFAQLGGEAFRKSVQNIEKTIREGDRYITYSHHVKEETLVRRFRIDPERVSVVPHGANALDQLLVPPADSCRASAPAAQQLFRQALRREQPVDGPSRLLDETVVTPYLFYASQARPHKNLGTLLRAYHLLRQQPQFCHKLVLTCSPEGCGTVVSLIETLQLKDDVFFLVRLTDAELAACYRKAELAVNPSLSEGGCPFTFTEALSVGTPVVMGRIPVTEEILSDPALQSSMLFDPYDYHDMARVIAWGIANRDALLASQKPVYQHLAQRTWREVSIDYAKVLTAAACARSPEPIRTQSKTGRSG